MSVWVDIPAHRILILSREEVESEWERINGEGQISTDCGENVAFIRRKRDGKLLKPARFAPQDALYRDVYPFEEP